MNAFNKRDVHECDKNLNFPHIAVMMNGNSIFTEKPPFHSVKYFEIISKASEWHHSCWDCRRVLHSGKNKVHLDLQFTRIWIMTNQDGHWGIKIRSIYM